MPKDATPKPPQTDFRGAWLSVDSVVCMLQWSANLDECSEDELRAHVMSWVRFQSSGGPAINAEEQGGQDAAGSATRSLKDRGFEWSPARKVGALSALVYLEHAAHEVKFNPRALLYSAAFGLVARERGHWRRASNWRITPEGRMLLRSFRLN